MLLDNISTLIQIAHVTSLVLSRGNIITCTVYSVLMILLRPSTDEEIQQEVMALGTMRVIMVACVSEKLFHGTSYVFPAFMEGQK